MKEIKKIDPVYIERYDINVNSYLTYAQIQQIVDAVKNMDNWAELNQAIDMLMLYHVTDIPMEQLEEVGHDNLLESGLISAVKVHVRNIESVYEALDYTTSVQRSLTMILKELPKYFEPFEKVMKKYGNQSSKK